ncbi:hypothetical protein [Solidesulfovibrio sp.]
MDEAKPKGLLQALTEAGLTPEQFEEIKQAVYGAELRTSGGVVPPPVSGEPAPDVLMQPGETILTRPQAKWLQEFAATIRQIGPVLRSGSGWRSRKLWVTLVTLAGMLAQLPMQEILPPVSQALICALAALYVIVQGILDALAKSRAVEPPA